MPNYFEIPVYSPQRSYGLTCSIFDHFLIRPSSVTLTLNLPETNVSNDTATPQGKQLCHIILKSMHKCTSYGPDKLKLMTILYHLTFNLSEQMFQMALLLLKENSCATLFSNPCIKVQVMAWTARMHNAQPMHAHTLN